MTHPAFHVQFSALHPHIKKQIKMQLDADWMLNRKFIMYCLIEDYIVKVNWSHVSNGRVETRSVSSMKKINVDADLTCLVGECLKLQWMGVKKYNHTATGREGDSAWHIWTDNILHLLYVIIGINNLLCRPLPPNLDLWKFTFNPSKKLRVIIHFTKGVTTRGFFKMAHLPSVSKVWFDSF